KSVEKFREASLAGSEQVTGGQYFGFTLHPGAGVHLVRTLTAQGERIVAGHLQVKLQPQDIVAVAKCLVFAAPAARKVYGPFGNGEGVAMPVQHGGRVVEQSSDGVGAAGGGALYGEPTDFPLGVATHRRAQYPGDQLRTKANPQHLFARLDALANKAL